MAKSYEEEEYAESRNRLWSDGRDSLGCAGRWQTVSAVGIMIFSGPRYDSVKTEANGSECS